MYTDWGHTSSVRESKVLHIKKMREFSGSLCIKYLKPAQSLVGSPSRLLPLSFKCVIWELKQYSSFCVCGMQMNCLVFT